MSQLNDIIERSCDTMLQHSLEDTQQDQGGNQGDH